jgi:serine/threonine protein kinase/tetratricopeptide (TPR) repeat protein
MNELDLFTSALALSDPAERAAFLDRACADAPDLRSRLDELVSAHARGENPLDRAVAAAGAAATADFAPDAATRTFGAPAGGPSAEATAGTVVAGKYALVEIIGAGGMGSVWRANQTEPVKRFVALKLIKAGMDSKQVLARFEAERQALAVMDHPNIAKVLDGGLHDGRPFFVMELVKGVPITEYCDTNKLTPKARLALFVQACQAIQHAHQKGIIHRDIKPSNVLVALYDDKPVVKVIDFGVAKATGGALTEHTLDTGFGGVVGTPQYMSPEQATFNNLDIDTRSDVYALGVLLYELLTGSPPFSRQELEKKGLLELLRVVREEEPPRPSTKLSTADALPSLSANRGTEPKRLTGLLRNELDWIVMKALEKDRTRRYETANGFAADVQRYLSGEAVQAHPPSAAYRLKKFVRRNRGRVLAASLVLLALVAGVIGTGIGLVRAEAARQREADERFKADRLARANAVLAEQETSAKNDADRKRQEAEQNLAYAREGQKVILGVFNRMTNDEATRANLQQAAKELDSATVGDPVSVALIRASLGDALVRVRDPGTAVRMYGLAHAVFKKHLGPDHPDVLEFGLSYAWGLSKALQHDQAVALYEDTFVRTQTVFGPHHPRTVTARARYGIGCARARLDDTAIDTLEDSVALCEKHFGGGHLLTLETMRVLAQLYYDQSVVEKKQFIRKMLTQHRQNEKKVGKAEWFAQLYYLEHATFSGPYSPLLYGSPKSWTSPSPPAPIAEARQRYAERWHRLGPVHPETLQSRRHLAEELQLAVGDVVHEIYLCPGEDGRHPNRPARFKPLARALDEPEAILFELTEAVRDWKADHPFRVETVRQLGDLYSERLKQYPGAWRTFRTQSRYGQALLGLGRRAEAEEHLIQGYRGLKDRELFLPEAASAAIPEALDRLIALYLAANNKDEVKRYRELRASYPEAAAQKLSDPEKPPLVAQKPKGDPKAPAVKPVLDLTALETDAKARRAELDPNNPRTLALPENLTRGYLAVGADHVWFGREKEWSEMCARALELAKGTKDPSTADRVAKACCILPTTEKARLDSILALARAGVEHGKGHQYLAYYQMALGMAEYRSGLFAEAEKTLAAAHAAGKQNSQIDGTASCFRAMALFRLGQVDDARKLLAEAEQRMRPRPSRTGAPLEPNTNPDDVIMWLAYNEAKALLHPAEPAPQPREKR